eukprot:9136763-Alexandrium_andersonii.AAC.1
MGPRELWACPCCHRAKASDPLNSGFRRQIRNLHEQRCKMHSSGAHGSSLRRRSGPRRPSLPLVGGSGAIRWETA